MKNATFVRKMSEHPIGGLFFLRAVPHLSQLVIAAAFVVGAALPVSPRIKIGAGLSAIAFIVTKLILQNNGTLPHNEKKGLLKGRMTAKIEGDFTVFMIGAKFNHVLPGKFDQYMGVSMNAMIRELEESGLESGFLGSEDFVGTTDGGTTTMNVQYWRSADHLQRYAQSQTNRHYSPWKTLMRVGRETTDFGFWHQTFNVRAGDYECIYANCPPLGLGICRDVELVPAKHGASTMAGRLGKKVATDPMPDDMRMDY